VKYLALKIHLLDVPCYQQLASPPFQLQHSPLVICSRTLCHNLKPGLQFRHLARKTRAIEMATFDIVIIGAGIAGIATALSLALKTVHKITIVEGSPVLTEAGAGIQISAAVSRLLSNWGLYEQMRAVATEPDFVEFHRYQNNERTGLTVANSHDYSRRLRGYPHWLIHRVNYQKILAEAAVAKGVTISFGRKVESIDADAVTITFEDGATLSPEIIIGADGIHSRTRRSIPTLETIGPRKSVYFCYRALIPRENVLRHPETAALIDNNCQQCWHGPSRHIISYPISRGQYYNVVAIHPDDGTALVGRYNQPGDVEEMRTAYKDFNPQVQALLSAADTCARWVIAELPPLPSWSSTNGRVILVGDACHAMTPHAASGAATAVEDAEVLGLCIAACNDLSELAQAAQDYEHLRKPRCTRIQDISRENAHFLNMPDGPAQEARDKIMTAQMEATLKMLEADSPLTAVEEDMDKPYPHPSVL
jgi:salicylate hydroxylase